MLQTALNELQRLNQENASLRAQLESAQRESPNMNSGVVSGGASPAAVGSRQQELIDDGPGSEASLFRLLRDTLKEQQVYLDRRAESMHEYRSALLQIGCEDGGLAAQLNTLTTMREAHIRRCAPPRLSPRESQRQAIGSAWRSL